MTLLRGRETTSESPDPFAELLIQEARRRQRLRHRAASAVVCIALVGLVLAYAAGGFSNPFRVTKPSSKNPPVRPSANDNHGIIAIKVANLYGTRGQPPADTAIAFGAGSTWVLGGKGVVRIKSVTGAIEAKIAIPYPTGHIGTAWNLAFGGGGLWVESVVLNTKGYLLSEISPTTNRIERQVVIDGGPNGTPQAGVMGSFQTFAAEGSDLLFAYASGVGSAEQLMLSTIDAKTGAVLSTTPVQYPPRISVVNGSDVTVNMVGALGAKRPKSTFVSSTVLGGDVWASSYELVNHLPTYVLHRFNAQTGAKRAGAVDGISLVAAGNGQLWGLEQPAFGGYGTLVEINPSSDKIIRSVVPPTPSSTSLPYFGGDTTGSVLAVANGAVWLVDVPADTVYRIAG